MILFGFTTAVAWSYYGNRSVVYLFGAKHVKAYNYVYVLFIFLGAVLPLEFVWNFGDIALSLMSIPNLIAVILLTKLVNKMSKDYFSREHIPYKQVLAASASAKESAKEEVKEVQHV